MTNSDQNAALSPALLLAAVQRLLRPLVRLMMRNGVTFPVLADALRRLFVDVAATELLTDPRSRTDSRISLLTGVHRKEIRRLRELSDDVQDVPEIVTMCSEIIARWLATPLFLDEYGKPKPLPRAAAATSCTGEIMPGEATFDRLVESVTTDVRPRAVLEDLLTQGVVFLDSNDHVRLDAQAFIPRPGGEEQLFYFARNLHDHLAAAVANISAAGAPPFVDRSVHYDRLTESQAGALEAYAREAAVRVLLDVNRHALELTESDAVGEAATQRVNLGIYLLRGPDQPAAGHRGPDHPAPDQLTKKGAA